MERYIGLDVHAASSTAVVIDARGKRVGSPHVLETNGQVLVEFFKTQPGTVHVCLEEGTQSTWLVELLSRHVETISVVQVTESRGQKDDVRDAHALAEKLRTGAIGRTVYKQTGPFTTLRQLTKTHTMVVRDCTRVRNRLHALYRSRGVRSTAKIYAQKNRASWMAKLPPSSQGAAMLLYAQLDAIEAVRAQAEKDVITESHRHAIATMLESLPGLAGIRVARLISVVVTPERFRTRQQFWSYCGLGIVMRSSSDWVQREPGGSWDRAPVMRTRGLNWNHNHTLKEVFKGAATTVIAQHPNDLLRKDYDRLLAAGTKPHLAKLTIARKLAAISLAMWKRKEEYDPAKYAKSS